MAKILTISKEDAQKLRIHLLQFYKKETGKEFTPVTYLGAYENLRTYIISKLSDYNEADASASVSVHRLRKLFYYTDPVYCHKDKLETLSFGDDFISLLRTLELRSTPFEIEVKSSNETNVQPKFSIKIAFGSILALSLSIYLLINFKLKKPYYFRDDFNNNSLADIKARGWNIIDFDSSLFFPQDTGVLTLRSSRGDYWVRAIDSPVIKNLAIHRIPSSCFEVTLSFSFQKTYENYQQCGIIFLDKDLQRRHNIRMSKVESQKSTPESHSFFTLKRDESEPTYYGWNETESLDYNCSKVFFKVVKSKGEYSFYFHCGYTSDAFKLANIVKFDFEPMYLGLVSFNGLREYTNGPLNTASSIPAKFDWIKIRECD